MSKKKTIVLCFTSALHCADGNFAVDASNQDVGRLVTRCFDVQHCKPGNLHLWNLGTLQNLGSFPDDMATLEHWLGCKTGLLLWLPIVGYK